MADRSPARPLVPGREGMGPMAGTGSGGGGGLLNTLTAGVKGFARSSLATPLPTAAGGVPPTAAAAPVTALVAPAATSGGGGSNVSAGGGGGASKPGAGSGGDGATASPTAASRGGKTKAAPAPANEGPPAVIGGPGPTSSFTSRFASAVASAKTAVAQSAVALGGTIKERGSAVAASVTGTGGAGSSSSGSGGGGGQGNRVGGKRKCDDTPAPSLADLDIRGLPRTQAALTATVAGGDTANTKLASAVSACKVVLCWYRIVDGTQFITAQVWPGECASYRDVTGQGDVERGGTEADGGGVKPAGDVVPMRPPPSSLTYIPCVDDVTSRLQLRAVARGDGTNVGISDTPIISLSEEVTTAAAALVVRGVEGVTLPGGTSDGAASTNGKPPVTVGDAIALPEADPVRLVGVTVPLNSEGSVDSMTPLSLDRTSPLLTPLAPLPAAEGGADVPNLPPRVEVQPTHGGVVRLRVRVEAVGDGDMNYFLRTVDTQRLHAVVHPFKQRVAAIVIDTTPTATQDCAPPASAAMFLVCVLTCSSPAERDGFVYACRVAMDRNPYGRDIPTAAASAASAALHSADADDVSGATLSSLSLPAATTMGASGTDETSVHSLSISDGDGADDGDAASVPASLADGELTSTLAGADATGLAPPASTEPPAAPDAAAHAVLTTTPGTEPMEVGSPQGNVAPAECAPPGQMTAPGDMAAPTTATGMAEVAAEVAEPTPLPPTITTMAEEAVASGWSAASAPSMPSLPPSLVTTEGAWPVAPAQGDTTMPIPTVDHAASAGVVGQGQPVPSPSPGAAATPTAAPAAISPPSTAVDVDKVVAAAVSSATAIAHATIATLQQQVSALNATCAGLQAQVAEGATVASKHAAAAGKAGEEVRRLTAALAATGEELKTAKQRLVKATEEMDAAKSALSSSRNDTADATKRIDKLQKQAAQANALLTEARAEVEANRSKVQSLSDALDVARTEGMTKTRQIADLMKQVEEVKRAGEAAAKERDRLSTSLTDKAGEAARASAALAVVQERVRVLESEAHVALEAATMAQTERDDLRSQVAALTHRLTDATGGEAAWKEKAESASIKLTLVTAEVESLRSRTTELARALDAATKERVAMSASLDAARAEASTLQGQVSTLESKVKRLAASADAGKALQAEVASLRDQVDVVTAERNAVQKKAESLRRDVARMTGGSDELRTLDIDALAKSKRSLEEKVVRLMDENAALREAMESGRAATRHAPAPTSPMPATPPSHAIAPFPGVVAGAGGGMHHSPLTATAHAPAPSASFLPSFFAPPPAAAGHVHAGGGGDSGEAAKARELQRLAQSLMEQIAEKDEVLAQQKTTKEMLAARIRDLEAEVTTLRGGGKM